MSKISVKFGRLVKKGDRGFESYADAFCGSGPNPQFVEFTFSSPVGEDKIEGGTIIIEPEGNDEIGTNGITSTVDFQADDSFARTISHDRFLCIEDAVEWAQLVVQAALLSQKFPEIG